MVRHVISVLEHIDNNPEGFLMECLLDMLTDFYSKYFDMIFVFYQTYKTKFLSNEHATTELESVKHSNKKFNSALGRFQFSVEKA